MEHTAYRIDSRDTIVWFDDGFRRFAEANGQPELPNRVVDTPIWHWIKGPSAMALHRALLYRARRATGPLQLNFRCDSPAERRLMRMTIVPHPAAGLEFRCVTVLATPRAPQALLDSNAVRGDALITLCAWCNRFRANGTWVEAEEALDDPALGLDGQLPGITHGVCDICFDVVAAA
jgi:hypothetical protein